MGARALNAILELWLFFSTFLWAHTPAQRIAGWIVSLLTVTDAVMALSRWKWPRLLNVALGGCLILAALLLPRVERATFWNDILVGFGLAFFGLAATADGLRAHRSADV